MKVRGGNPRIVTNGLKLHYDAENPRSYPGTGTTVYDISNNGFNGTLTNASVGTTTSNVFTFNGNHITFSEPLNQDNLEQKWTIQSWVKRVRETRYAYCVEGMNNNVSWEFSTTLKPLNYLNSGDNDSYTYGNVDDFAGGVWVFSTFTFDRVNYNPGRVTIQADLNTQSVGTNVNTGDIPSGIAATLSFGSNCSNTESKNLLIYNRELTTAEITQNYNAQKIRYGL